MSDAPKTTLPKLRTFAQDLERIREKSGQPLPEDVTVPVAKQAPVPSSLKRAVTADVAAIAATATPAPTHIPAFHELKKKASAPLVPKAPGIQKGPDITTTTAGPAPKKIQVRTKKRSGKPAEQKAVSGGTIITDTKKGDFKLVPSVLASIDRFVASIAKAFKKKQAPTYSITATERRKGVIQKATSKTGTIFTADSDTLKDEIRRRQRLSTNRVDPQDGKTDVLWSPHTEPGYALIEGETVRARNVAVEFKKRAVPIPAVAPIVVAPIPPVPTPPTPVPEPVYEPLPEPAPIEIPKPTEPEPIYEEEVIPEPVEEAPSIETLLEEEVYTEPEAPGETPELSWASVRNLDDVSKLRTNTLAISIVSFVLAIVVIVVVVRALVGFIMPDKETELLLLPATALTEKASVQDVVLSPVTPEQFITTVREYNPTEVAVQELRFVDEDGVAIPALTLLKLLAFSVDPNFNQSVTEMRVATMPTSRAFVFKVTDNATVLGSLLEWEETMASDVASFLSLTETPTNESFTDQTYGKTDLRMLQVNGKVALVYGFIDENTVVITSDLNSFSTLLGE